MRFACPEKWVNSNELQLMLLPKCNKNGPRCFWVDTMMALQFGVAPETKCQTCEDAALGWKDIIKASIENIKYYSMD